jgi:hypothetical protein
MTLTYGGNLGLGITNPTSKLQVSGAVSASSLNVSGDLSATGAGSSASVRTLYVYGGKSEIFDISGNQIFPEGDENVNITSGVSTFFDIQVTNNGIFDQRIGIGNTNPLGALHIGDYENDIANSILITPSGIGIGTDNLSGVDATFYALDNFAVFGLIGIGTTTIVDEDTSFYVVGNSEFVGSIVANTSNISGISTTSRLNVGIGGTVITTLTSGRVGINSTIPSGTLDVVGDVKVGINTSQGLILTSPNGTRYRLVVANDGTLSTVAI